MWDSDHLNPILLPQENLMLLIICHDVVNKCGRIFGYTCWNVDEWKISITGEKLGISK